MVGSNDVNQVGSQSLSQRITVGLCLDAGVTLDACPELRIVFITEHEVRYAGFCRNFLFVERAVF